MMRSRTHTCVYNGLLLMRDLSSQDQTNLTSTIYPKYTFSSIISENGNRLPKPRRPDLGTEELACTSTGNIDIILR